MSRIGLKPIVIPQGVKVELNGSVVKVTGPIGSIQMHCHPNINVSVEGDKILVKNPQAEVRSCKQLHGTMRALIANMVEGATKGFERKLEIYGTGYNVKEQGGKLVLTVGYADAVEKPIPKGVKVKIEVPATKGGDVPAKFTVSGTDKCIVGQFVSEVRKIRPPEPYKGKGIRYAGEHIKRKVGKAFTSGTA